MEHLRASALATSHAHTQQQQRQPAWPHPPGAAEELDSAYARVVATRSEKEAEREARRAAGLVGSWAGWRLAAPVRVAHPPRPPPHAAAARLGAAAAAPLASRGALGALHGEFGAASGHGLPPLRRAAPPAQAGGGGPDADVLREVDAILSAAVGEMEAEQQRRRGGGGDDGDEDGSRVVRVSGEQVAGWVAARARGALRGG